MIRLRATWWMVCAWAIISIGVPLTTIEAAETTDKKKEFEEFKKSKEFPTAIVMTQWVLWRMGFYEAPPLTSTIDARTKKALSEYQSQRNLKVTGDLDANTLDRVMLDSEALDPESVILGSFSFQDTFWDSSFYALGTWEFEDKSEKMGMPLQTTKIECYRNLGLCIDATATLGFKNFLSVTIENFGIERWDAFEIVTKPYDYECVRYVLRINRPQKTVKKLRTTIRTKEICKGIIADDMYIRLTNGIDVSWKENQQKNKTRSKLWSKNLSEAFDKFLESEKIK